MMIRLPQNKSFIQGKSYNILTLPFSSFFTQSFGENGAIYLAALVYAFFKRAEFNSNNNMLQNHSYVRQT